MELSAFYPKPNALLQSEAKVLLHLKNSPYIARSHPAFARHASAYYDQVRNGGALSFSSHLDLWHAALENKQAARADRRNRCPNVRLLLSSQVKWKKDDYSLITHCLTVLKRRSHNQYVILRKFHFDVVAGETPGNSLQRSPRCHIQYCGQITPYMEEMGIRREQLKPLHPMLSEPRVLFAPMSLALMLDMVFREFPDPESRKFREAAEWRGIVREHEELMLLPYFTACTKILQNGAGANMNFVDRLYVV